MKKLFIITILTAALSMMTSCAGNFHLHNSVIEQTDCYNSSKDTSYYASVPYINHNYVYKVKVKYDTVTYEEIEKKKMWTNWKGPLGITLHAAAWIGLILLF